MHFVSEAEIEQVTNYVEPQEDDEHYVTKECVKLRDRASGYMWDSCKSTLKDRAPARDEDATINEEIVTGGAFKHKVEFSPIVIEAFTGKFTVNFKPIEHTVTP